MKAKADAFNEFPIQERIFVNEVTGRTQLTESVIVPAERAAEFGIDLPDKHGSKVQLFRYGMKSLQHALSQ